MSGIQVGWGKSWELLANAINDWYGGGIDGVQYKQVVQMLNSGNYTMEEMEGILQEIPEFVASYNSEGKLVGVTYGAKSAGNTTTGAAANAINSNAATATNTQFQSVQTISKDAQTGKVTISDNVKKYNAGTPTTVKAVATSALQGVIAASAGITVGKTIDQLAYDSGFNWLSWAGVDMEDLNPATWASITSDYDGPLGDVFNFVFHIDPNTGNPQAYMSETTFAYMVAYMDAVGVFDGEWTPTEEITNDLVLTGGNAGTITTEYYNSNVDKVLITKSIDLVGHPYSFVAASHMDAQHAFDDCVYPDFYVIGKNSDNTLKGVAVFCDTIDTDYYYVSYYGSYGSSTAFATASSPSHVTCNGVTYSVCNIFPELAGYDSLSPLDTGANVNTFLTAIGFGTTLESIPGITDQTGATVFDPSGISDPSDISTVLAALMSQYPELWDNRIEVSPDGDNVIKYIPVGFPTGGVGQQPTTNGATQSDLAPDITGDGDNATDSLVKTLIDMLQHPLEKAGMESDTTTPTEPVDPNIDDVGSGVTPPFVIPTGSASALYSVYNPSQSQLNSLGAWLWSSNFVDQLLKLFNDPMQAIIGLHKVFATPPTSGTGTIKVGYLDSGVGSNLVSAQYTEIDCGTVKLNEYFKNSLDYTKTDVYLYLPFVGIVPLNVEDVTRANINVKYKVDVLTGACLASVNVTRDAGGGGQLYVYAGNCAVQYPLSSGSYMGIVASALGIAGSIAGTVLSGGAMLPVALGVGASALGGARTKVEHSGSLSGNSGAMGIKKPYLIIRRPQAKIANNFELLAGMSQNEYGVLSSYRGQTRVKYVHLENIPATDKELTQIEELLKSGVLI